MEIFDKSKTIQDLLIALDIPRFPFLYTLEQGIGPYDPEFFDKNHEKRLRCEAKADSALKSMSDEELWELHESQGRLDDFAFECSLFDPPPWYAGGFGVQAFRPDYTYWSKMDYWTFDEATCLSIGFSPDNMPIRPISPNSPYKSVHFYQRRLALIQRAQNITTANPNEVNPHSFVVWAVNKPLEIPPQLIEAFSINKTTKQPAMLKAVDIRKYDSAQKVILGLMSSLFGYRNGPITPEMKRDIKSGLENLGISIDPKTIVNCLGEAMSNRRRFETDQKKRDERDS